MKYIMYIATLLMSISALAEPGRIYLQTANPQIKTGSEFYVDVMVADLPDVYGVQLTLNYDAKSITLVDQDTKTKGAQLEHGNFLNANGLYVLRNQANTQQGTIQYIVSQVAPTKSAAGSGRLARLYFSGPADATDTELSIQVAEFGTRSGEKYTYTPHAALNLSFDTNYQIQAKPGIALKAWGLGLAACFLLLALTSTLFRRSRLETKAQPTT
ncbi:cohesin domain-containing protein [Pseudoalteromonas sp. PPB1]|uniref:cohesin domain-containing protein n=1 Tax=Pseudoalteromonas sp. PPB1 TaxID=2756136 RepID=UPI001890B83C|nr:cohesin domain-containing protein [Pseudoalteromonas sp. PPB1]